MEKSHTYFRRDMMAELKRISLDWKSSIEKDMPDFGPITEDVVSQAKKFSRFFRGSVRMSLGKILTDEKYEKYKKKVLTTPLP